jgi:hypothetical protein
MGIEKPKEKGQKKLKRKRRNGRGEKVIIFWKGASLEGSL